MLWTQSRLRKGAGIGGLLLLAAGLTGSSAQASSDRDVVRTCVKDNGSLRVLAPADSCANGERLVVLAPGETTTPGSATPPSRPILLSVPGLTGTSRLAGHEGDIVLGSMQFGAGVGVGSAVGGDRHTSAPSVSEITVTKAADGASNGLLRALLSGRVLQRVVLTECADTTCTTAAASYELSDVIISGYSTSNGGTGAQESLSLNVARFEVSRGADVLAYDLGRNAVR